MAVRGSPYLYSQSVASAKGLRSRKFHLHRASSYACDCESNLFCERRGRGKAVVKINASSVHVGPIQDDGLHVGLDFEKKRRYPQQIARKNL